MLAALGGVALAFDAPGRQSLTFQMVGPRELPNAVALNSGLFNGSRVIGPAIAGLVIAAVGTGLCFVLNAVSFLAVLTALAIVREEELRPVARDPSARRRRRNPPGVRVRVERPAAAPRSSRSSPSSRPSASTSTSSCRSSPPTRCTSGPEGFGLLSASFGLGALVGALATATFREASWRLFAIGTASLRRPRAPARAGAERRISPAILLFGIGISFTLFTANANALVQLAAPDHLRGRLIGLYLFAFLGLAPIGGLFAGWLAEVGGTSLAFAVAGVMSLATIGAREREPLAPS